jgi:hypothetical protein
MGEGGGAFGVRTGTPGCCCKLCLRETCLSSRASVSRGLLLPTRGMRKERAKDCGPPNASARPNLATNLGYPRENTSSGGAIVLWRECSWPMQLVAQVIAGLGHSATAGIACWGEKMLGFLRFYISRCAHDLCGKNRSGGVGRLWYNRGPAKYSVRRNCGCLGVGRWRACHVS